MKAVRGSSISDSNQMGAAAALIVFFLLPALIVRREKLKEFGKFEL